MNDVILECFEYNQHFVAMMNIINLAKKANIEGKFQRHMSEEGRKNISAAMKGKKHSIKLKHWHLENGKRVWTD